MKSCLSAVTLSLAALLAAPVHADTVSYRFGGTFDSVLQHADTWKTVPSATSDGFVFKPGQTFTGILTYSTDLPKVQHGQIPGYQAYGGKVLISLSVPSTGFAILGQGAGAWTGAGVSNDHPTLFDAFGVETYDESYHLSVEFHDTSNSVYSDLSIPSQLNLADFDQPFFWIQTRNGTTPPLLARGSITSLEAISAVPEPDTWLMLAAGLGLLGWTRYRGQQQARRG